MGEWVTGLGLAFTNSGGTCGKWDMCLCFGCGGVGGVVLCLYVVVSLDSLVLMAGPGISILCLADSCAF